MKIITKIALRYALVTAILMTLFAGIICLFSALDRQVEFYADLYKEGVSKANLFFEAKMNAETMQEIYKNNSTYIDEVEVAIYDQDHRLHYHDAKEIDIVKETPALLSAIAQSMESVTFYEGKYQVVGFVFHHRDSDYLVTAAAYDGYGYNKFNKLLLNLIILTFCAIVLSFAIGYFLAKRALRPVSEISDEMKKITANKLHLRLEKYGNKDEFGQLAASFNNTLDIIEHAYESQKMFVSNVSHELRTPLSVLVGEIDFALLKERSVEEYVQTLHHAKQDSIRLITLVNGLLDLAKASSDERKITKEAIRIDELILDAREAVLSANPNYKIDLQFMDATADDGELVIMANAYLLKVAFQNLMENNGKFSENGMCTVGIYTQGAQIKLEFSDQGIGIPEADLPHVFTAFFRGKNKSFKDGNGIGLALVEKVVKIHKGTVSVTSIVGKGTMFTWRF